MRKKRGLITDIDAECGFDSFDISRREVDEAGEERAEARREEGIKAGAQRRIRKRFALSDAPVVCHPERSEGSHNVWLITQVSPRDAAAYVRSLACPRDDIRSRRYY